MGVNSGCGFIFDSLYYTFLQNARYIILKCVITAIL